MDEKELEALFELLQESESGLEDINEARAIIETEGIGTFFPLVEDSFESAEQFQQAFPSLKKKDDSQFSSEEEVMVSDTEQVQEPGSSEPSPQIPSEPAGSSITTPPIQPEVVETTEEEVVTETPVEENLMDTETEEMYQSDGLITDEYTSAGIIEATDEDVDNLPGILGLFDYNEWIDFGDDVVKTVENAVDRGNTVDEALKLLYEGADAKDIDIENFLKVLEDLENGEYVREEEEWNKSKEKWGGGAFGWLMAYYENPTRAPLALIQSVTQLANKASVSAGGTVVAGTTAAGAIGGGGAGALPAFVASLPWAYGAASATLETGLTFAELLEEKVRENGDEWNLEGVKKVLSNPEDLQDLRIKSAGRGAVIGLVDKYTGGVTSSMVKKASKDISKQTLKEGLKTAVKVEAVGSVGGGVGEVLGMTVAGQEYDVAEILDEMFIGTQGTAVEAGSAITLNKIRPAVYKLNSKGKDGIVSEQDMITFLKTATDAEIAEAEVTIENNSALKKIAEDRKNKAQKDAIVKAELKRLGINNEQDLNELTSLEHEKSRLEKDNTRASKRRLVEVNNRIDEILDNTKVETTAEVEVTEDVEVTEEEIDNKLKELKPNTDIATEDERVIAKKILIKEKQDAIQKPSTESVDVQESTQDSQEVGEGDTPGQPTQEGQENQTDIETQQETEIETPAFEQVDETVSMNRSKIPPNKTRFAFSELVKETAVKAGKALKNIVPEIKIVLHENANDFADQANDNANNRGVYDNNTKTIHINLEKAKRSTIAHETFHAIILSKLKTDVNTQQVTKRMMLSLAKTLPKDSALLKKVNEFAANYDANLQNEEKVAEIVGELSSNYQQLSAPQKSLIRRWINKIAQTLGIKKELDSATQTDQDVIDLLNTISKKVRTGETITEQDVSALDEGTQLTLFEGGQEVDKPADALKRQQVGDFEVTYTQQESVADMIKKGLITEPQDISFIEDAAVTITSPDDMLAGEIKYKGKVIFEGEGGVFFVTKFGDVWASGKEGTANTIANSLNRQLKENGGKAYLTLTKGSDKKLISSASGVKSTLAILDVMLDNNLISPSLFRSAVSTAVRNAGGNINLRQSAKDLKQDVNNYFTDPTTTTFEKRGFIIEQIVGEVAKNLPKESKKAIITFLNGDANKSLAKDSSATANGLVDLIARIAAEQLTKGLNTGDVYAVIEVNGEVEVTKDSHPSYPFHIALKDKSNPILHLLKNRQPGSQVLVQKSGKAYAVRNVSVVEGRVQKPVKETKKTPVKRQQKGQPTTMAKLMNFYKMDKDGFIEPKNVYDLDALEEWAGKVGYRVDRSRGDRGETTKYYLRDKQADKKFNPVTKRQQKGEMTGYERMMKEVEGIISKSEKRGVKFNKISENVIEYIKGSKVYERATDIQREKLLRDARERFGIKDKPSVTMNKLFDKLKDVKKITVSDKTLLYQRLRDLNRGAKTAKAAFVKGSKELAATTKELVSSGRISAKQAAAVISRFSKVNMFNDASVNSFIDYMANVFKDAEYSSKMAFANKKRKQAKKNIFTKLGKADGLLGSLNRLLSVNPTLIPDSVLNKYLEVLEMFGERAAVLTLDEKSKSIKDVESILEALDTEQSKVDELSLIFADSNNKVYNDNDSINYAETVKKMLDEGEITTEYADLMRKYKKDISPQLEDTQQTDAELDQERQDIIKRFDNVIIDKDSLPTREERSLVKRLDKLINTVALDQLNITQLKNLLKVIDNINNGYLPHYAQLLVESMEAINDGDTLADGISKGKPLPLSKIYANFKSLLTRKDAYLEMIRRNPLVYIDQVFGNFKGKDIYNSLFNPIAKAKATFDKAFSTVQQRIERAQNKVEKSFKSDMNKLLKSSFKQTAYMVQLEFESNPDSKQVNPAAEYIKSTIKAIRDGKTHYTEKDAQVLEDILEDFSDSEGNINLDKLYNSFNPAEKNSIKVIQDVNKEMLPLAEYTSGVIRGDKINPIDNYVHLNVIPDTTETIKGTDSVTEFSDSLNPSTKAKSLISRTGKVAPLNFNIYSSAQRGAKFVLLDRYMTEPVRTARRTLKFAENKLEQDNNGRIPKEQRKIFNAIKGAFNEAIEMDLVNMFTESTLGDRAFDYMSKQGYRTMLAGTGRFAAELLANLSYAVFVNPQALLTAGKLRSFVMSADAVQVMDNVNSTQTNRMFPGDKLSGRMVDTNILNQSIGKKDSKTKSIVANKLQQIYNLSLKKYMNFVELTADTLISSPDKMIMKPIWFGSFANAFKEAAGVEVDLDKIAKNDEAYMTKYADAIKTAQVKADENSVQAGATTNPYQTFLKGKTNKNQSISARAFNIFNNFMQNFLIFEYMTARTGINAAVGNGMINKIQGAKMIAGVTSRMVLYTLLVKVMGSGLIGLFSDEEEEEKKDVDKQVGQAVLSAFSTLLLGRDFGNVTKSLINIGVENFNEQNLEMLRDGEYDPYKDALQYTITAGRREYKGYDLGKIMLNLFGPYTPAIKTLSFGVSKLGEPKRKTKAARERQEREISERLPLEILGNLGLIPIYKDVRKEVIGTIYKDINKKPSTPMSDKDMKKYHPELYRMQKDLEKRTPQTPNIPTPPTPKLPR